MHNQFTPLKDDTMTDNFEQTTEKNLTQALKMVLLAYRKLGFEDTHILGKAHLCLQGFVKDDGEFTDEYIALAKQAIEIRKSKAFRDSLELDNLPTNSSLILPNGIERK
jgi:hypothetical protein